MARLVAFIMKLGVDMIEEHDVHNLQGTSCLYIYLRNIIGNTDEN